MRARVWGEGAVDEPLDPNHFWVAILQLQKLFLVKFVYDISVIGEFFATFLCDRRRLCLADTFVHFQDFAVVWRFLKSKVDDVHRAHFNIPEAAADGNFLNGWRARTLIAAGHLERSTLTSVFSFLSTGSLIDCASSRAMCTMPQASFSQQIEPYGTCGVTEVGNTACRRLLGVGLDGVWA